MVTPGLTEERTVMFSARIDPELKRRVKLYAAGTGESVQAITEAALTEYLDRHVDK